MDIMKLDQHVLLVHILVLPVQDPQLHVYLVQVPLTEFLLQLLQLTVLVWMDTLIIILVVRSVIILNVLLVVP